MTAKHDELFFEFNSKLISLFSDFEFGRIKESPELLGLNPSLVESKLKSEPIRLPCKIIFDIGQILGIESKLEWLFLELQIKYFLLKNGSL